MEDNKGLFGKILLGGVALGAVAATAFTYVKKYKELDNEQNEDTDVLPETEEFTEDTKRKYSKIDMGTAKKAAKRTAESIKDGSVKAWNCAKDSAKAVGGVVMDNYGNKTKNAVTDTYENVKEFTLEKTGIVKDKVQDVYGNVKEKVQDAYGEVKERFTGNGEDGTSFKEKAEEFKNNVTESLEDAKALVKDKFDTFKNENPDFLEGLDNAKKSVERAYENVKDRVSAFVNNTGDMEVTPDDETFVNNDSDNQ